MLSVFDRCATTTSPLQKKKYTIQIAGITATMITLYTKQKYRERGKKVVQDRRGFSSASRAVMTSAIVLRRAGSLCQHPSIISHTLLESSGWLGRGGRRPFSIA